MSGYPVLIQGGMGVGVSNYVLARAVAVAAEKLDESALGVVSGIGLALTMVNRLRRGDLDTRAALEAFPVPEIAQEIIDAANNTGWAVKKKTDTHRMAEANRAFAHFAW